MPKEVHVNDIVKYLDREQQKDTQDGKKTQIDLICEGADGHAEGRQAVREEEILE